MHFRRQKISATFLFVFPKKIHLFVSQVIIGVSAAFLVWDAIDLGFTISDLVTCPYHPFFFRSLHWIFAFSSFHLHWIFAGAEEGKPVGEGVEGQGGDVEGRLGGDLC